MKATIYSAWLKYVLGSKLDHLLAHHFTDSNNALDSVLLLAEHNETLLTCGGKQNAMSWHIKTMRGILKGLLRDHQIQVSYTCSQTRLYSQERDCIMYVVINKCQSN